MSLLFATHSLFTQRLSVVPVTDNRCQGREWNRVRGWRTERRMVGVARRRSLEVTMQREPMGPTNELLAKVFEIVGGGVRVLSSSNGQVFLWGFLVYLVLSGNLAFVFNTVFLLIALVTILPIVGLFVFRLIFSRYLIEGKCANCGYPVAGIKGQTFNCSNCGVQLQAENDGSFTISDPASATLDVTFREEDEN